MTPEPRARPVTPERMDDAQRAFYDMVVAGPRGQRFRDQLVAADGSLRGPFEFLILDPALGEPIQRIGEVLRFGSVLRADVRELAILVVAAVVPSRFEWDSHHPLAVAASLPDPALRSLHRLAYGGSADPFGDPLLDLVVRAGAQMCDGGQVDDETFAALSDSLGSGGAFALLGLFGYYTMLAMLLNAYQTPSV
jgi:4-carboxymuconolactone decarboxylase